MLIIWKIFKGGRSKSGSRTQFIEQDPYKISTKPVEPQVIAQQPTGDTTETADLQINKVGT